MRRLSATQRDGKWMRLRAVLLAAAMLALFGIVLVRAAKVQLLDRSRLSRLQRDQTRRELEWVPRRGMIVDRRGEPLAVTRDVDSVFADPSAFETPRAREAVAAQLAGALRLDRRKIAEKLAQSDRRFVWIKRRIDEASARRVRGLALDGIELVKEPKRFYPQRELAGHVLGFVGDESGQEGLERELETFLKGTAVQVQATRDARGTMVLEHGAPDPADLTGATVTLTLDTAIQLAAEKELAKAVKTSGAVGGWAIAMDVNSGAVLALAGNPAFDANKPGRDPLIWRDRAIQDQLEPGSTIKSFVVARAIDEGALRSDEILYCEHGAWARAGKKIHDTHPVDWATPATVLRESSNICAAKIGERLGKQKLIDGLRAFGFGEKTGVGLPGEARGALADPKRMPQIALWTTSFGQGMSATAIQTVAAMAAIANGGVLLRPYLVQKVVGADGTVLLSRGREEVRRVLKEESAREVTAMLEEVVEKGTGTRAALVGHRAAGKTGTAQKVDPVGGGYGEKRLSSFLGFAPADEPRVAILVAIDEPEGKGADVTGGTVAAPAWAAIAHEALRQLDVMPDDARVDAPVLVSSLAGSADPEPAPEEAARMPLRPGQAMVPDVSGMGARTATRRLAQAALEPELRGSGRAVAQSPRAGAIVKRGARVKVTLAPPG
ncbi:MAG: PASTA domain-containing protein [Deltaproteobacteria bacterium]|nr:MAG: PASTA domain-containing protein [Deltaproteobacteria bacterium]